MWGLHPHNWGRSHTEFAKVTDLIVKARNFSRADILDMTDEEIQDTLDAIVETEQEIERRQRARR